MKSNENAKTAWFLAVAVLVIGLAWVSRPQVATVKDEPIGVGRRLFPDFNDPGVVADLQVLRYDQDKGDSRVLEVARRNGLWVIPSHAGYPADAKDHLADAANSLIDLTILGVAPGFDKGSQPLGKAALRDAYNRYGVVDPDPNNVKYSDKGIGARVTMKDSAGRQLASAIIGKTLPDQSDQCYIRVADKEPVFIVKLDASKLSVGFADWIEPNLLNLNSMDLKKVEIKDYSVEPMLDPTRGGIVLGTDPKGQFVLDAPSGDQPWKLSEELAFDTAKKELLPVKLAANEEVNTTNLDALKSALEDLKIVDVERKPGAVPADLQVRKIDDQTRRQLMARGFFAVPKSKDPDGPEDILSNSGDISLQMADGARYILRFGVTLGESSANKAKQAGNAKAVKDDKAKDDSSPGMDRYLFVAADFNQDAIPKPVLEKLPEVKPMEKAASTTTDKGKTPAAGTGQAKKGETKKKEAKKPAEDSAAVAAKRAEVEKENKRRQEEYDGKVAAGKKHVKELSDRFAQWYYVIPGQTYAKIHLGRNDIIKKKAPPKEAAGHDHDHAGALPASPAATLEQLKKDAPGTPK